jgi:hypothetical protein
VPGPDPRRPDWLDAHLLCFVTDDFAWFADRDPREVYGDDWDDAPHDCNAGEPYPNRGWQLVKVAFDGEHEVVTRLNNSPGEPYLSAKQLNARCSPWLVVNPYGTRRDQHPIWAGCTIRKFAALIALGNGHIYTQTTVASAYAPVATGMAR